jgi:hypothetical protein
MGMMCAVRRLVTAFAGRDFLRNPSNSLQVGRTFTISLDRIGEEHLFGDSLVSVPIGRGSPGAWAGRPAFSGVR